MKRILIDTNAYSAFMLGKREIVTAISEAREVFICPIVLGELLAGFKGGSKEKKNRTELESFLDNAQVEEVSIDSETSEFYTEVYRSLRAKGRPIPSNDLWIAASALKHGLPLCTLDTHFDAIDGLVLVTF